VALKILVTGAAGFIASNLIPRLLARGDEIYGVDNFFLGKRAYVVKPDRFHFHEFDLLDLDRLVQLFESSEPDMVWHLAANSDISFGTKYTDFDLKGGTLATYNILEAIRRTGASMPSRSRARSAGRTIGCRREMRLSWVIALRSAGRLSYCMPERS